MLGHGKGFIFAQEKDRKGDNDASTIFIPRAKTFATQMNSKQPVLVDGDNGYRDARKKTYEELRKNGGGLDWIAYFGHGTGKGLVSAGIFMDHIPEFVAVLNGLINPGCKIIFYACSTGKPNGFAEALAKALKGRATVFGHTCPGRACANPFVVRYPYAPDTTPFLVEENGPLWTRWQKALKDGYWKKFPFLTKEQIVHDLENMGKPKVVAPHLAQAAAKPGMLPAGAKAPHHAHQPHGHGHRPGHATPRLPIIF